MMRRARPLGPFVIAVLAGALAVPGSARGQDDAGVESPFTTGAGNRALAMGGAYAAVSDDASAVGWNPAGLGFVQRRHLLASHASLYGVETLDDFVACAWPSWRWGAGAVSVRRLGVSDIDGRDARNFPIGDFDAGETELALGWGRALDEAWSVGAGLKVRRQKIGDASGTGFGVDLGAMVRPGRALGHETAWASRLMAGVALRDLLPPSIRLDAEGVKDPRAISAGVSWRQPVAGHASVLLATEIRKVERGGTALRAGLEADVHPCLALRAGFDGEDPVAGAALRWKGVAFDYLWEDNAIASVHRFGVSLGFGPTVEESRVAHARAEEEAFRRRLDETFAARQVERRRELLERGAALLAAGDGAGAAEVAATLRALDPEDEDALALQVHALLEQAAAREAEDDLADAALLYGRARALAPDDSTAQVGLARVREESDRRSARGAKIRELMTASLDAFGQGDLSTARARLRELLDVAPDDAEARSLLTRTDTAIAVRASALLAQARAALDRKMVDDAERALAEVRRLRPQLAEIATLEQRARRIEAEIQAAARPPGQVASPSGPEPLVAKAPALSTKRRREVSDLYRRGLEAMDAQRTDEALRYWELVWAADPAFENVAEYLKQEYLLRGLESFSHGDLDDAVTFWERAYEVDPTDEKTVGYLSRAREQLARSREILGE